MVAGEAELQCSRRRPASDCLHCRSDGVIASRIRLRARDVSQKPERLGGASKPVLRLGSVARRAVFPRHPYRQAGGDGAVHLAWIRQRASRPLLKHPAPSDQQGRAASKANRADPQQPEPAHPAFEHSRGGVSGNGASRKPLARPPSAARPASVGVSHHLPSAGPSAPLPFVAVEDIEVDASPHTMRQAGTGILPEQPFAAGIDF